MLRYGPSPSSVPTQHERLIIKQVARENGTVADRLQRKVVKPGICVGCGACVALDPGGRSAMERTPRGPQPVYAPGADLPELAWEACPGKGVDYPRLYRDH